jgi:hypothetical protein
VHIYTNGFVVIPIGNSRAIKPRDRRRGRPRTRDATAGAILERLRELQITQPTLTDLERRKLVARETGKRLKYVRQQEVYCQQFSLASSTASSGWRMSMVKLAAPGTVLGDQLSPRKHSDFDCDAAIRRELERVDEELLSGRCRPDR